MSDESVNEENFDFPNEEVKKVTTTVKKSNPPKVDKAKKQYSADDNSIRSIDVTKIVSNKNNPRESVPLLASYGYGVFEQLPATDKPALVSLALSPDSEDKEEFVSLIDKFEPEIRDLAVDLKINGFIQPCVVRPIEDGGYDLEVGCRRTLATLYNHAKSGDAPFIRAVVSNDSDERALYKSFSENIHRLQMSPVEEADWYDKLQKQGMNVREISEKNGVNEQHVRQRLRLLSLDDETRKGVHKGDLSIKAAMDTLKDEKPKKGGGSGGGGSGTTERKRIPTRDEFKTMYADDGSLDEKVREFIALKILHTDYVPFEEIQRLKSVASKGKGKKKNDDDDDDDE